MISSLELAMGVSGVDATSGPDLGASSGGRRSTGTN